MVGTNKVSGVKIVGFDQPSSVIGTFTSGTKRGNPFILQEEQSVLELNTPQRCASVSESTQGRVEQVGRERSEEPNKPLEGAR